MLQDLLTTVKATSDETRLRILKLLQGNELCVCQLMAVLDMSSSTVSSHLAILRQAEIVKTKRAGRWVYYSWQSEEKNPYVLPLLHLVQKGLTDDPLIKADQSRLHEILQIPLTDICVASGRVTTPSKGGENK